MKLRPGGTMKPFCEPETKTSMPSSSVLSSMQPRLVTASTITKAPCSFINGIKAFKLFAVPVEVSE